MQAAELPVNFQTQTGCEPNELLIQMSQCCTLCLHHFSYAISGKTTTLPALGRRECTYAKNLSINKTHFHYIQFLLKFFSSCKIMFYILHSYCIFIIKHFTKILFRIPSLYRCSVLEKMRENYPRWQILTILFSALVETSGVIVMKTIQFLTCMA